eukprot:6208312-Pleurochrysis_carterae.AAC.1
MSKGCRIKRMSREADQSSVALPAKAPGDPSSPRPCTPQSVAESPQAARARAFWVSVGVGGVDAASAADKDGQDEQVGLRAARVAHGRGRAGARARKPARAQAAAAAATAVLSTPSAPLLRPHARRRTPALPFDGPGIFQRH